MIEGALLVDRAYFYSMEWEGQKNNAGGFSTAAAWFDLLALTNVRGGAFEKRGLKIEVQRGQCAWSILGLADRWGWGQGKVAARLKSWETSGRISVLKSNEGSIITVTNYEAYQSALADLAGEQIGNKSGTNQDQTVSKSGQIGIGIGITDMSKGGGSGSHPDVEVPSDDQVQEFAEGFKDIARGILAGMPEAWWRDTLAMLLQNHEQWLAGDGKGRKFPTDWQRWLRNKFLADFAARHPKALGLISAKPVAGQGFEKNGARANESGPQQLWRLNDELREVRGRLDSAHALNTPPDAGDVARENELETELEKLRGLNAA